MRGITIFFLTLIVIVSFSVFAKPPEGTQTNFTNPSKSIDSDTYINANKLLMLTTNVGSFAYDLGGLFGKTDGLYYPFTSLSDITFGFNDRTLIYAAGLWLGSVENGIGDTLIALAGYSQEYVPGPMVGGTFQPDNPSFRVYKLYADSMAGNPNQDYLDWPVDQGAPVDEYGNPELTGDQTLWTIFNDADPSQHTNNSGKTAPLGVEVHQRIWAVDEPGIIEIPQLDRFLSAVHITGGSRGTVGVELVEMDPLIGHSYMVVFRDDFTYGLVWDLINVSTGITILENQTNQSGDGLYATVEGIKVHVVRGAAGVIDWSIPNGTRRFTWAGGADGFGWEGFFGAIGWGGPGDTHGFGGYDPVPEESLINVLLKLAEVDVYGNYDPNDPNVSYGYRYLRGANGPPARPEFVPYIINPSSYGFQAFEKNIPLSAWNVSVNPPKRLTMGFLENNTFNGLVDGKYFPGSYVDYDNVSSLGPREWLWIFLDDYSETLNPAYALNAIDDPMPIMYWSTAARRGDVPFNTGDEFLIIAGPGELNTPADTFIFTVPDDEPLSSGPEGLSIYIEHKIFNKGGKNLINCYASIWADPDLGDAGDDMVGCDTVLDFGYCYNGDPYDGIYDTYVPAVGFQVIESPVVYTGNIYDTAKYWGTDLVRYENIGMTAFSKFINGTDPQSKFESYYYMQGLKQDGSDYVDEFGVTTKFQFAGDPVTGTGAVDFDQADRRMFITTGPFNLGTTDSLCFTVKLAVGQGTDYLSSITALRDIFMNDPDDCCIIRGDLNHLGGDLPIDITDLTFLIDYMFREGAAPYCDEEADLDDSGEIDISDLTFLIDFMFREGPAPAPCN